jgi:hypothetical protein
MKRGEGMREVIQRRERETKERKVNKHESTSILREKDQINKENF